MLHYFASAWFYPLFIISAFLIESREDRAFCLSLLALSSLFFSVLLFRRYRMIKDTTDTNLGSAAQGYVQLEGITSLYDGEAARGHFELPPSVWFRNFYRTSNAGFLLHDSGGRCTIDTRGAQVIAPLSSYNLTYYWAIFPGETIYVLGQLETLKQYRTNDERKGLVAQKLLDLKRDQHRFLDYFDSDNNGKIDADELQAAKQSAERLVDETLEMQYQAPPTHVIGLPDDHRPFIISSIHPDKLLKRYQIACAGHLITWVYLSILTLIMI